MPLDAKQFHYAFTNTLSQEESREVYGRYHVRGPGRALGHRVRQPHRHQVTGVNFAETNGPPCCSSPAATTTSCRRGRAGNAEHTPGRRRSPIQGVPGPTALHGAPGWEEVADYALDWAVARRGRWLPRERGQRATIDGPNRRPDPGRAAPPFLGGFAYRSRHDHDPTRRALQDAEHGSGCAASATPRARRGERRRRSSPSDPRSPLRRSPRRSREPAPAAARP